MSSLDYFKEFAFETLTDVGIKPFLLDATVKGLVHYYSSVNRTYHNYHHIISMVITMHEAGFRNNLVLAFSVLFHDVYYRVGLEDGENERISARIAMEVLDDCIVGPSFKSDVIESILATAKFMESSQTHAHCQMICDLDLSSLALEQYSYFVKQQKKILLEHGVHDLSKSASFLKSLIDNRGDDLFYTEYAKNKWLDLAKSNIKRFVEEYSK